MRKWDIVTSVVKIMVILLPIFSKNNFTLSGVITASHSHDTFGTAFTPDATHTFSMGQHLGRKF